MAWTPKFTFSATWDNVSNKPATATRWPTWSEVTGKPANITLWAEIAPDSKADSSTVTALAERADLTEARLGSMEGVVNASFERDGGWGVLASDTTFFEYSGSRSGTRVLSFRPSTVADRNQINEARVDVAEGQTIRAGVWARWGGNAKPQSSSTVSVIVRGYDKDGGYISGSTQTLASLSGDQLSTNYQIIEGALSVPPNWFYAALQLRVQNYSGPESGLIALDDAFLQVDSRGVRAISTELAQMQAEVTDHEDRINALTGNALVNPGFENSIDAWSTTWVGDTPGLPSGWSRYTTAGSGIRTGTGALRINNEGTIYNLRRIKVTEGQPVRLGFWSRMIGTAPTSGSYLEVLVRNFAADGSQVSFAITSAQRQSDGITQYSYVLTDGLYTPPPGTVEITFALRSRNHVSGSWIVDDMFAEPLSNTLTEMMAKYSLAVTAGDIVEGKQLLSGGGITPIKFATLESAGTVSDSFGDVRKLRFRTANGTTTLTAGDLNGAVEKSNNSNYTYTIPSGLGAQGDAITIVNSGTGGNITLARASGVQLYRNGTNANTTVSPGSMVTIYRSATSNRWIA